MPQNRVGYSIPHVTLNTISNVVVGGGTKFVGRIHNAYTRIGVIRIV